MEFKKYVYIILLFCSSVPALNSQQKQIQVTTRSLNGGYWNRMSPEQRIVFLQGFRAGLNVAILVGKYECMESIEESRSSYESAFTYEELQAAIDSFYKDASNRSIPITAAIQYIVKKAKGAASRELDEFLEIYRSMGAVGRSNIEP
jgi:hypothetical protein